MKRIAMESHMTEDARRTALWSIVQDGYVKLMYYARDTLQITPRQATLSLLLAARAVAESHDIQDLRDIFDDIMRLSLVDKNDPRAQRIKPEQFN